MDYPKSTPNVGLVDGKFVDENTASGQPGSLIPSAWANALTDEVLAVIKAAGAAPNEDDKTQLRQAIQTISASDVKRTVRVATTAAIALSGVQTVDGVLLAVGDRVLVKNQANGAQNWIFTVASNAWVRALDATDDAQCTPGHLIIVQAGAANGGSVWQLSNTAQPQVGTTPLTFVQVFGRTGIAAGTFRSVTVDAQGRVTAGTNPTTLDGYGLTSPVYDLIRSQMAAFGLASSTTGAVAAVGDVPALQSGNYYYPSPIATALGYSVPMFVQRFTYATNRGFELANVPYQKRMMVRVSNNDGTWQAPFELASLDSPAFTNTPTAPTAAAGTNTKQLANTEFVQQAIAALVASAPGALDTLKELAAAMGNDPNFAVTMTNALATKAAKGDSYLKSDTYAKTETYSQTQVDELFGRTLSKEYASPQQALVSGGLITLAHGLGAAPKLITAELVCLAEDGGYSVGDVVLCPMSVDYPASGNYNGVFFKDASNIYFRMASTNFYIGRKSSTGAFATTLSKWAMVVRAWV